MAQASTFVKPQTKSENFAIFWYVIVLRLTISQPLPLDKETHRKQTAKSITVVDHFPQVLQEHCYL